MAHRSDTQMPELLEDLCLLLLQSSDTESAHRLWEGLVEVGGSRPGTWMIGGLIAFAEGRYADAEGAYRQVLALRPQNVGAHCFLAESLIAQRRLADADAVLARLGGPSSTGDPELAFAQALREGLSSGLFRQAAATAPRRFALR